MPRFPWGLSVVCAVAVLIEYLDDTLKADDETDQRFGLPQAPRVSIATDEAQRRVEAQTAGDIDTDTAANAGDNDRGGLHEVFPFAWQLDMTVDLPLCCPEGQVDCRVLFFPRGPRLATLLARVGTRGQS